MTTGYYRADWRDGGAVPGVIGTGAGAIFASLDYFLLNGPNPWSKVNVGTNIESYQAPAGSQIKITVYDEYPTTGGSPNSYFCKVLAEVSGQTFPIPAQQTSPGFPTIVKSYANLNLGWIGIRSDRFMWYAQRSTATNCPDFVFAAGDFPVFDPLDPGLCAVIGHVRTAYPSTGSTANTTNIESTGTSHHGYAYVNKTNNVISPYVYNMPFIRGIASMTSQLADHAGGFQVYPIGLSTGTTQASTSTPIPRGWLPWAYHVPFYQGATFLKNAVTAGDTFSAGAANFELAIWGTSSYPGCIMLNDQEPLP